MDEKIAQGLCINPANSMKAEQLMNVVVSSTQNDTIVAIKEAMDRNKSFHKFYRERYSISGVPTNIDVDVYSVFIALRLNKA